MHRWAENHYQGLEDLSNITEQAKIQKSAIELECYLPHRLK